jgi:hypothetical protein
VTFQSSARKLVVRISFHISLTIILGKLYIVFKSLRGLERSKSHEAFST